MMRKTRLLMKRSCCISSSLKAMRWRCNQFQCHGGEIIGRKVLNECLLLGARIARAGEFTKRAYLNGRLDLAKQMLSPKWSPQETLLFKCALKQLKGDLGTFVEQVRTSLVNALAHTRKRQSIIVKEDIPSDIIHYESACWSPLPRAWTISTLFLKRPSQGHSLCLIGKPNVGRYPCLMHFYSMNAP